MPSCLSLRLVVLVWLLRTMALRRWWYWMASAVRSKSSLLALSSSHQDCTTALVAARTWQTVTSGFFPPQLLTDGCQKQVAHGGEDQVPFQADLATPLPVRQAHFSLLVLEAAFDRPARKPTFNSCFRGVSRGALLRKYFISPVSGWRQSSRWRRPPADHLHS